MQSRGFTKWLSDQIGRDRAQSRVRKGRGGSRTHAVRLCGILAVVLVGAYLSVKIMGVLMGGSSSTTSSTAAGKSAVSGVQGKGVGSSLRANKMLLTGADSTLPGSQGESFKTAVTSPAKRPGPALHGLWEPNSANLMQAASNSAITGTTTEPQQAQQGSNAQLNRSAALTDALESKDAKTIEQALADSLTDSGGHSSSGQLSSAIGNSTASVGGIQQAFSNATQVVGQMLPGVRSVGMLGGGVNKTQADPGAASQQLAKEKKGWSSLLDDGVSTAQNKTSLLQGVANVSRGGLAQSQAVADASQSALTQPQTMPDASQTAHTQSRGGDAMSQEQLRAQFKGLGSLRDEYSSQQGSDVIQPETNKQAVTQQGTTQQGLTQQGSNQTEHGTTMSQTGTSGLANRLDMPYSGNDSAQADLSLSSADASEATLASTTTQTDSSQNKASQSQTGSTESVGTQTWELESPESLQAQGLPEDWYWVTYLQMNQDVASAVGRDAASAKMHYHKWGKEEGRPYKVSMLADWRSRQESLQELAKARQQAAAAASSSSKTVEAISDDMAVLPASKTAAGDSTFGNLAAQSRSQSEPDVQAAAANIM
ncbi:TPA: hypothetical protein ACH3X1_011526 [Trebouxia sp. C0004]